MSGTDVHKTTAIQFFAYERLLAYPPDDAPESRDKISKIKRRVEEAQSDTLQCSEARKIGNDPVVGYQLTCHFRPGKEHRFTDGSWSNVQNIFHNIFNIAFSLGADVQEIYEPGAVASGRSSIDQPLTGCLVLLLPNGARKNNMPERLCAPLSY